MYCKYNGEFLRIDQEDDETYEDYHMRCIFIMKNQGKLDFNALLGYSHVYKNMNILGCVYSEEVNEVVHQLTKNLYIT